jgi:3-hydroxy-5-methyl-1-naphthoate 3-O-methyltransferase
VHCEILDVPEVVPLTTEYVNQAGVSSQVSVRAGDILQGEFGRGFDLILLNAICHMFSEDQNRDIFRRARQALAPNGRLVVQDFILNPEKTGPQHAALFSLNMLVGTESSAAYSEPECTQWMEAAGFAEVSRINLPGPSCLIVAQVK